MTALSQRLREETLPLHRVAERAGIMAELLRGRLDRDAYVALLRDLLAVYEALEGAIASHREAPALRGIHDPALERVSALREDLHALAGATWEGMLHPGDAARDYAARIAAATPLQLAAHAYVRYLGDLSGGQALGQVVARTLGLSLERGSAGGEGSAASSDDLPGVSFYRFPAIADVNAYKARFRDALDAIPLAEGEGDLAVAEAQEGFRLNVRVFEDVARRTAPSAAPPPPLGA